MSSFNPSQNYSMPGSYQASHMDTGASQASDRPQPPMVDPLNQGQMQYFNASDRPQPPMVDPLNQGQMQYSNTQDHPMGSDGHQGSSTGFWASQAPDQPPYHTYSHQDQRYSFTENNDPLPNELMRFPDDGPFVPYNETSIAAFAHHAAGGVFGGQSRPPLPTGNMATNILNAASDPSHAPLSAPSQHTQLPALLGPQAGIPNAPAVQDVTFSFEIRGSADRHPYTVYLSRPAQIEDLGQFDPNDRSYIHEYLKTNGKQGNAELKQWYKEICPAYWSNIIRLCANDIPASMVDEVHKQLCASKFGIKDPWSGHALFKRVWNPSRQDKNQGYNIIRLKAWMYRGEETTQQTWRETLRSKDEEKDRVVPWVPREVILAVWVIMKEGKAEDPSNPSMVKKREELEACKLMYQISNQEWVQPDPYWEGFMEELALDPQQEHLYAKVMGDAPAVPAVPAAPAAPAPAAVPAAHTQEIIADKDAYIAFLEGLLHENGIEFPRRRDA